MIKNWLDIPSIQTIDWSVNLSIDDWWSMTACKASPNRKAIASLNMLVSWTI
jgi:hypothetical protein